jgi:hypothetical protein
MNDHPLIAVHGFKQSGKDTLAHLLVSEYGFQRLAFADRVKDAIHIIFSVPKADLYGSDTDKQKLSPVKWSDLEQVDREQKDDPTHLSIRELLQIFATEICRDKIPSIWYRFLPIQNQELTVISDLRFLNEAEHLRSLNALIIEVKRPSAMASHHASESGLPPDLIHHTLQNDSDLETFLKKGRNLFSQLGVRPKITS